MADWNSYTYTGVAGHSYEPAQHGYFHLNGNGQYVHGYHHRTGNDHDRYHHVHYQHHAKRHVLGSGDHHHHEKSHHSHNHVSNPNVSHYHHVSGHSHEHKTYIHHQKGKEHEHGGTSNHLPQGHVVTHHGKSTGHVLKHSKHPPTHGVQPQHPRHTPSIVTKTPKPTKTSVAPPPPQHFKPGTGSYVPPKPGTKPATHTTDKGPLHPGINFGTAGTDVVDPNVYNRPGEGAATHISAVNKNGKVPTTSTYTGEGQPAPKPLGEKLHNWGHKILQAYTNFGVWENNTVTGRHDPYETDQSKVQLTAKDLQQGIANDYVHTMHNIAVWERDRLHDIGIDVVP